MSQEDQERYPAIQVNSSIPLPSAPRSIDDTVSYIQRLHYWLADNQVEIANAINNLAYHRATISTEDDEGNTGSTSSGAAVSMPMPTGEQRVARCHRQVWGDRAHLC